MGIKVYTVEELIEIMDRTNEDFIKYIKNAPKINASNAPIKKKNTGEFFKTEFFDGNKKLTYKGILWCCAKDIEITKGVTDPEHDDQRNMNSTKTHFSTNVISSNSFGEFMEKFNEKWLALAEKFKEENPKHKTKPIIELIKKGYFDENGDFKQFNSPTIKLKIDFGKYVQNYPIKSMAGKVITEVLNFEDKYIDDKKKVCFKPAVVMNDNEEEPLDAYNVHKFLTRGSIIKHMRFSISSMMPSQFGIVLLIKVNRLIVEHKVEEDEEEFTDEIFVDEVNEQQSTEQTEQTEQVDDSIEDI